MINLISVILGALSIYSCFKLGPVILMAILLVMEIGSVSKKLKIRYGWFVIGALAFIVFNLFVELASFSFLPIIYLGIYLFIRKNIDEWMLDCSVRDWPFILFAFSFPIFLSFISKLYAIDWSFVTFALVYVLFLRFTDALITTKFFVVFFYLSQVISILLLETHLFPLPVNVTVLIIGITIWSIVKFNTNIIGGIFINVQRLFVGQLYRESR